MKKLKNSFSFFCFGFSNLSEKVEKVQKTQKEMSFPAFTGVRANIQSLAAVSGQLEELTNDKLTNDYFKSKTKFIQIYSI